LTCLVAGISASLLTLAPASAAASASAPGLASAPGWASHAHPTGNRHHSGGAVPAQKKPGHASKHSGKRPTGTSTSGRGKRVSAHAVKPASGPAPASRHAGGSRATLELDPADVSQPVQGTQRQYFTHGRPGPAVTRSGTTWVPPQGNREGELRGALAAGFRAAGGPAGFPALLLAVVVAFLLVQHRLDRRDVKLSTADWASDDGLEFRPPSRADGTGSAPQAVRNFSGAR
jgi:hypothetical protein